MLTLLLECHISGRALLDPTYSWCHSRISSFVHRHEGDSDKQIHYSQCPRHNLPPAILTLPITPFNAARRFPLRNYSYGEYITQVECPHSPHFTLESWPNDGLCSPRLIFLINITSHLAIKASIASVVGFKAITFRALQIIPSVRDGNAVSWDDMAALFELDV